MRLFLIHYYSNTPTCTPVDTKIAKKLAKIAGVDIQEFAMEMFKAGTSLVGKTVDEIFNQDFKKFSFDKLTSRGCSK